MLYVHTHDNDTSTACVAPTFAIHADVATHSALRFPRSKGIYIGMICPLHYLRSLRQGIHYHGTYKNVQLVQ